MQSYAHVEAATRTIACIEQFEVLRTREDAAHAATYALMHGVIRDSDGRETSIFELADAQDVADAVQHVACDMFIALVQAGFTYREFTQMTGVQVIQIPRQARAAVRQFYAVISNVRPLYRRVMEDGESILAPFDWHIDNYLNA